MIGLALLAVVVSAFLMGRTNTSYKSKAAELIPPNCITVCNLFPKPATKTACQTLCSAIVIDLGSSKENKVCVDSCKNQIAKNKETLPLQGMSADQAQARFCTEQNCKIIINGVKSPTTIPTPVCSQAWYCLLSDKICHKTSSNYNSALNQCGTSISCATNLTNYLPNKTTGACYSSAAACDTATVCTAPTPAVVP